VSGLAKSRLKIVIFGRYHAGKSSLIQSLDPGSKHIEAENAKDTTTVAFDLGRVHFKGEEVYLFGTPGQERFEFVREIVAHGMDAALLVVDSTQEVDLMTLNQFAYLKDSKIPFAVLLNKCDSPDARPGKLRPLFHETMIFEVSTRDTRQVMDMLERFVESLE
jgi:small GTP-binding protein